MKIEASESKRKDGVEVSIHPFQPLHPDTRPESRSTDRKEILQTEPKIYGTMEGNSDLIQAPSSRGTREKSTIISAGLMMTNACLGTTIFTFAVKAKSFGLVWLLVAVVIVGIINYWSIMAGAKASSKCEEDDYSEITQKILGRKARVILNCILVVYSYACMMCFLALLFPLFGRFIKSISYTN